jgi:hypothetical protein
VGVASNEWAGSRDKATPCMIANSSFTLEPLKCVRNRPI